MKNNNISKGKIVIYQPKGGEVELRVKLEKETIWLTQKQISNLFNAERSVITKHLRNIFNSGEIKEESNVQKMHIAFSDKPVKFYNLDVIISVGYRVNSQRATQFRIWATKVLKDYLIQGYALNQKGLLEQARSFKELQRAISFIKQKSVYPKLKSQTEELLNIIDEYAQSLTLLYRYDEGKLTLNKKKRPCFILKYKDCQLLIKKIKIQLSEKGEATQLFGQEVNQRFESIMGAIYQTFDKKELYLSIEEKAANLLYLTIKDHPFTDGNKRIGSLFFVYFLERNNYLWKANNERKITNNTLVALALLIASSDPKEKEVMIKIITNLLK